MDSHCVFDHYYGCYYAQLMRVTSDEENLQAKKAYERLSYTNRASLCTYRLDNKIL